MTLALDRAAVAALLPHQGAMCLVDGVVAHDDTRIACVSHGHRDPAHPLARDGRLSSVVAVELAAQATALHGALTRGDGGRPLHGRLARVRDCVLKCERMDLLPAPLVVEAERVAVGERALSYRFAVRAGGDLVASGTLLIALTPDAG